MKKTLSLLAAGVALAGAGTTAHAQTATQAVQKPISIKLGAFFPTQSSGRDVGGSTQFSAGLDYALVKTAENNPALPSIYFDYQGGSKDGGRANTYALGVAIRKYTNAPSGSNGGGISPYVGAGIGAYDVDVKNQNSNSVNKVGFGGKVFAGLEFSQAYFLEANYQFVPQERGINPSGVGVQIGARF